jgi:hypothetical protein
MSTTPVAIGNRKQLFVDDHVVARTENVRREPGVATKQGVVLEPTLQTEFQSGHIHAGPDGGHGFESAFCWFWSPHWDTERQMFRLWYMAGKRAGTGLSYAESADGYTWTKPLVARDGRSNLVNWTAPVPILKQKRSVDLVEIGLDGVIVTIDPSIPAGHPEKYKVAFYPNSGGVDGRTRLGYSADGIEWHLYNDGYPVTERAADTNNQIHFNPLTGRYLLHCRQDFAAGGGIGELRGVRIMEHTEGNDLLHHPTAWKTLTTFALEDPDTSVVPGTDTPVHQIHTFPMWHYEGVWFGLTDVLAATNKHVTDGEQDYHEPHDRGVWEFYLSPSRDGISYDFSVATYPRKPLIARGPAGSYDKDCVRPPSNIITKDDEHWIYYLATNERWGCHRWDARLALAKLRLDGFFYLEPHDRSATATIVTKPFVLEGPVLEVNVDAAGGALQVEVLDDTGEPIVGYAGDAASVRSDVAEVRYRPAWRAGADLSALQGRRVRLRFSLRRARLFAFQLVEPAVAPAAAASLA